MGWTILSILFFALQVPAQTGAVVTETMRIEIDNRIHIARKINGRWWSEDNRELSQTNVGWLWNISGNARHLVRFDHHRPLDPAKVDHVDRSMGPDQVRAILGPPNSVFPVTSRPRSKSGITTAPEATSSRYTSAQAAVSSMQPLSLMESPCLRTFRILLSASMESQPRNRSRNRRRNSRNDRSRIRKRNSGNSSGRRWPSAVLREIQLPRGEVVNKPTIRQYRWI